MFLPIYLLTLGLSAAIFGVFGRRILAAQGMLPDFSAGLTVTLAIAAAYVAVQLLFIGFLRLAKPTRGTGPLLSECLSHASALALVPYLLGLSYDWPYEILNKVEPLLYLAAFAGVHLFFKLLTLFSATHSESGQRIGSLGWFTGAAISLYGIAFSYNLYQDSIQSARLAPLQPEAAVRVGDRIVMARPAAEGSIYTFELPPSPNKHMILRWANHPDAEQPLPEVDINLWLDNEPVELADDTLDLSQGWAELKIPAGLSRGEAHQCSIAWSGETKASWLQRVGLLTLNYGERQLLISGPFFHNERASSSGPNVIIVGVEGIGAEHVGHMGYERATMPQLAAFSRNALTFSHAYTPAPEVVGASMTLLTGVNPLVHKFLGPARGPLPDGVRPLPALLQEKGYLTAAFTEAEGGDEADVIYGSGFEEGFEIFETTYPQQGSRVTLERATEWLQANQDTQTMLFLRLRELRRPTQTARYGGTFSDAVQSQRPLDIYDNALFYLDQHLGEFLGRVRAMSASGDTCILVASTYGFDFSGGWSARGVPALTEPSLRVPAYLQGPRQAGRFSNAIVELEDLSVTLAALAGVTFPHPITGRNLLEKSPESQAISMSAEPVVLTLRNNDWRFTWQSGFYPFSQAPLGEQGVVEFINIPYYLRNWRQPDNLTRERTLAERYREQLWLYLKRYLEQPGEQSNPQVEEALPGETPKPAA